MDTIISTIDSLLSSIGIASENIPQVRQISIIVIVIAMALLAFYISHSILARVVRGITRKTSARWDDHLFNDSVLKAVCHILPPIVIYVFVPIAFEGMPTAISMTKKALSIYLTFASVHLINSFISGMYNILCEKEDTEGHPLKGVFQMLKLLSICVGVIITISLIIDRSPIIILSGLGATAAILTLVFKDTILGLVAGIQLSANNMVKPGDWIEVPKHNINGFVIDVTLVTVKVQNWDKTISTIPPYYLVSESFQNWRGMFESGGRRVKRSLYIDVNSITFCTKGQMRLFKKSGWLNGIEDMPEKEMVNLRVFRNYLEQYLHSHQNVAQDMNILVRQMQPTPQGLPLELYFFTNNTAWVTYEGIQSTIFEHILARLPQFGLRLFQSPTGNDLTALTTAPAKV